MKIVKNLLSLRLLKTIATVLMISSGIVIPIAINNSTSTFIPNNIRLRNINTKAPVNLNGSLEDNFVVDYAKDHVIPIIKSTSFGRSDDYWNISFSNNIPNFKNYSRHYVSDVANMANEIDSRPQEVFNNNAIDIDYINKDGSTNAAAETIFNDVIKTYGASPIDATKYGFGYNVNDPIQLTPLTNELPLLRLSYQYLANNQEFQTEPSWPDLTVTYQNKWAFNGYIGLNKNLEPVLYKPTDKPSLEVVSVPTNRNMLASEFVNNFSQFKKGIRLKLKNFLPLDQVTDLRLESDDAQGKVYLKYKVKNTISVTDNWYSDIDTTPSQDISLELATGFITNTEVVINQVNGAIITEGFMPSTVNDDLFKQWIFNVRNDVFNSIPSSLTVNDIKVTNRQETNDSLSYEVSLTKYYENGRLVDNPQGKSFGVVTIVNFKQITPTQVVAKQDYQNQSITFNNKTTTWQETSPSLIEQIITANSQDAGNDNKASIINKLVTITGDIPIVNNNYSKITDVKVVQVLPAEGKIQLAFVLDNAFVLNPNATIEQNKEFNITFEGLKRIYPTNVISNITLTGYEKYVISSIANNPNQDALNQLKEAIKTKILEAYNDQTNNTTFGQVPPNTQVIEITFKNDTADNANGTINISYRLNQYYDANGSVQQDKNFDDPNSPTTVTGFYQATPTTLKTEFTVPNQQDTVPSLNWLTIDNLKAAQVNLSDIVNNTFDQLILFDNSNISLNTLDASNITITPKSIDLAQGTITAKVVLNKGFKEENQKVLYSDQLQGVVVEDFVFRGFKNVNQPTIKDNIEINIADIAPLANLANATLSQLVFNDQTTMTQLISEVKNKIFNSINEYVDNAPTGISSDDIIITKTQANNFDNTNGSLTINFKFNKYYDPTSGQLTQVPDDYANNNNLVKDINIIGFKPLTNPTINTLEINQHELANVYLLDFTIDNAKTIIELATTKEALQIPNINIASNQALSAIGNIDYGPNPTLTKKLDANQAPVAELTFSVNNIYKQDNNQVIYAPGESINVTITFKGFKQVQNAIINGSANLSQNPLIAANIAQYWVMDDDANKTETTLAKLTEIVNSINDTTTNIIDDANKQLLAPGAKLVVSIEQVTDLNQNVFSNGAGTLNVKMHLSHIYNEFHEVVENTQPTDTNVILSGFKTIDNPTYIDNVSIDLTNDPIFGQDNLYDDTITDDMIIAKLNDPEFRKKFINNPDQFTITFNNSNTTITRDTTTSTISVVVKTAGFDQNLIELNEAYQAPFNGFISTAINIVTKNSGTTTINQSLDNVIIQNKYVDELINLEASPKVLKDQAGLLNDIKAVIPDVKTMFDTSQGRIDQNLSWNNFSEVKLNLTEANELSGQTNAANGSLEIKFVMTSGFYYENNAKVEATTQNPKEFITTIYTQNKRPITKFADQITLNFADVINQPIDNLNKLYTYEVIDKVTKPNISTGIINYLKDDAHLSTVLADANPDSTPGQNPWISNPFVNMPVDGFDVIANNKEGKLIVDIKLIANKDCIYGTNGFKATQDLEQPNRNELVVQSNGQEPIRVTTPFGLHFEKEKQWRIAKKDNISIDDAIKQYNNSKTELIYQELYASYQEQVKGNNDLIVFDGLNVNANYSYTLEQFKQWIHIDTSKAVINKSGKITNVRVEVKNQYFINDPYYSWVATNENKPLVFEGVEVFAYGPKKEIIWPYIVGAISGVVAILIIVLIIFLWMRRKNKVKQIKES